MWSLIARRLLQFPLVILLVYVVTFLLISAAGGDPLLVREDARVSPEVLELQRRYYGLDAPWYEQGWRYASTLVGGLARGELRLGHSIYYNGKPVAEIIGLTDATWPTGALRTSMTLGLLALAIALLAGMNLGLWAGTRQNSLADHATVAATVVGISLPTFVTGSLLILLLGIAIPVFPVGGWGRPRQMVLPAVTLSLPFLAYIARLMRAGTLDVLHADYVRTARAKGLPEREVARKHVFKLAFLPVLSYLGPASAAILTGSFVVETLFAVPGLGEHFVTSVINRDQPLILGTVLVYSVLLVSFNFLVDVAYLFVDPRIGHKEAL